MKKATFGIIGMGVMGKSLAINCLDHGISVAAYNRVESSNPDLISQLNTEFADRAFYGFNELDSFVQQLEAPRKILLMVTAGAAVDSVLQDLLPLLQPGDCVLDGGNSNYLDTQRRCKLLEEKEIHYLGVGISGGEQGALKGPAMMVGGSRMAYEKVKAILEPIAAKDSALQPCVNLLGPDGAGHLVKTVHNGIEYAEMQLLAECFGMLKQQYSYEEIAEIFERWNQSDLQSYLLEITIDILRKKEKDQHLLDVILDVAASKGTGSWTVQIAAQFAVPASIIHAALEARYLSMLKATRERLDTKISEENNKILSIDRLEEAYRMSRVLNHSQGFEIIHAVSKAHQWEVDLSEVARIWTNGCIIKSSLMKQLQEVFAESLSVWNDQEWVKTLEMNALDLQFVNVWAIQKGCSIPCFSAAWNYWNSITTKDSTANLIQAQRDYFGAHTYRRKDRPSDQFFTTKWEHDE